MWRLVLIKRVGEEDGKFGRGSIISKDRKVYSDEKE